MDSITSEHITRLVDQIRAATPATAIILFGSQAKGMATKESDIDVCVITRETAKRKLVITREIRKSIASTILLPVDILVYQNLFECPARLPEAGLGNLRLRFPAFAAYNTIYGRALLIRGEYLKLIGSAGRFIAIASVFPNLLGVIYTYIYLAAANRQVFRESEALSGLKRALDIAMPDRVYMPFVENGDYIEPLLVKMDGVNCHRDGIARIRELYQPYRKLKGQSGCGSVWTSLTGSFL